MMENEKQKARTARNRSLLIEQRLMKKYYQSREIGGGSGQSNGDVITQINKTGTSPKDDIAAGQTFHVVRAFGCDDGTPIDLEYDNKSFIDPSGIFSSEQSTTSISASQNLPYNFEAFRDDSKSVYSRIAENEVKTPEQIDHKIKNTHPSNTPHSQLAPELNTKTRNIPNPATSNLNSKDQFTQQSLVREEADTFAMDLQELLTEARRRANAGQEVSTLSPVSAGSIVNPIPVNPPSQSQQPAITVESPDSQKKIAGTATTDRHALFNQLGEQMQRAVTFDIGAVPVDKTFASIEASIDAEAAQLRAVKKAQTNQKKTPAKPLTAIEAVEDMALMTAPKKDKVSSVEAYMLSSDIPLDPGIGGKSIPVNALEVGDVIVSTTKEVPSWLIRFGTQAPVSHAILYIGDGQVVEAIEEGVVLHSVEDAIADSYLAVAFRHLGLTPEQALRIRDYAGQQIGKPFNYVGILQQALFQLDKRTFCEGKRGDEYDRCICWAGKINLGTATNDRFFCSELVLKSFETAGVPLTTTPPNYTRPGELLQLQQEGKLVYVGHLKYEP